MIQLMAKLSYLPQMPLSRNRSCYWFPPILAKQLARIFRPPLDRQVWEFNVNTGFEDLWGGIL